MGGVTHRTRLPAAGDDLALQGAATSRRRRSASSSRRAAAGARRFCAPTARFGTAATRRAGTARQGGASPRRRRHTSRRRISGLANGDRAVVLSLRTAGKATSAITTDTVAFKDYSAAVASITRRLELVRGVPAGRGELGVLVRPELREREREGSAARTRGCAATPGRRSTARRSRAEGACCRPRWRWTTEVTHWAERDDGVVTAQGAGRGARRRHRRRRTTPSRSSRRCGPRPACRGEPEQFLVEYDAGASSRERTGPPGARGCPRRTTRRGSSRRGPVEGHLPLRLERDLPEDAGSAPAIPDREFRTSRAWCSPASTASGTWFCTPSARCGRHRSWWRRRSRWLHPGASPNHARGATARRRAGTGPSSFKSRGGLSRRARRKKRRPPSEVQITITANEEADVTNFVVETYRPDV